MLIGQLFVITFFYARMHPDSVRLEQGEFKVKWLEFAAEAKKPGGGDDSAAGDRIKATRQFLNNIQTEYACCGYDDVNDPVGCEGTGVPCTGSCSRPHVELDGAASEVEHLMGLLQSLLEGSGATKIRVAKNEEERLKLWAGRKAAFPAMGRISPDYYCMDGTIPRGKLPHVLQRIRELAEPFGLAVANVFHAGDGNLHPLVLYDSNREGELEKAEELGAEILKLCVEVGGVLSGEHGIGVEKRELMPCMFGDEDLDAQERIKEAFDPGRLYNPGKVFPVLRRCIEGGRMHVHAGEENFPHLERF